MLQVLSAVSIISCFAADLAVVLLVEVVEPVVLAAERDQREDHAAETEIERERERREAEAERENQQMMVSRL